jgi:uncharacterized protein YciI
MFVISLTYTAPLEQIDAHLAAHRAFLSEQYARGVLLVSGPRLPREGGIIIANVASREAAEELVRQDPFHLAGVARYEFVQFVPALRADVLDGLLLH